MCLAEKITDTGVHVWNYSKGEFDFYPTKPWNSFPQVIMCPKCGVVWAKTFSNWPNAQWQAVSIVCEKCPGWITSPAGSLWLKWQIEFNAVMSRDLLLREFNLLTKEVEHLP